MDITSTFRKIVGHSNLQTKFRQERNQSDYLTKVQSKLELLRMTILYDLERMYFLYYFQYFALESYAFFSYTKSL